MENIQLPQLNNNVEIIGILKSKEFEVKQQLATGKNYITGKLVVQSKIDNRINEQTIKVFVMESSKLFKGIETVKDEYKTIEVDGIDNADRIKVRGSLKLCEYYSNQGNLVQFNEVRGMYFNRLEKNYTQPDHAIASIETVVQGFTEKLGSDGLPTGEFHVNGFTVGYKNEVIEFKNVIIGSEIAQAFMNLYYPGSTGRLSYQLNHYDVDEQTSSTQQSHGFGKNVTVESSNSNKNFVHNIEIIGGDFPYSNGREYTQNNIVNAKRLRAIQLSDLQNKNNSSIPMANSGFSKRVATNIPVSNDDIPDF